MSTIQDKIESGYITTAYCENSQCRHSAKLDWIALRDRLGPDHGTMRDDILPLLVCSKCGGRDIDIKVSPDPDRTPGMGGNAYERAKERR